MTADPRPLRVIQWATGAVGTEMVTTKDFQIFDHQVQAGTTAGQRWNVVGLRKGEPLIEEHVRAGLTAVAMQVVNAIPAICSAPAGFATTADLPPIRSYTGFGDTPSSC